MKTKSLIFLIALFLAGACEVFEYSPYSADVPGGMKGTNNKSLLKLSEIEENKDSICVAVFGDPHYYYGHLEDAVSSINKQDGVVFAICVGDLSDQGLLKEYTIFHDIASKLKMPYFTVIGNHDYRSKGERIYTQMFGELNYSIEYKGYRFVFWDNVFWESDKRPDFEWLENELIDAGDQPVVLTSHIPPTDDQFDSEGRSEFKRLINDYNVMMSLHGHHHNPVEFYEGEVECIVAGSVYKSSYQVITLYNDGTYKNKRVYF